MPDEIGRFKAVNHREMFESSIKNLRGTGDQLTGLCPFHKDSRPSFSVNIKDGRWICHTGCGSGGAISFAKRIGMGGITEPVGFRSISATLKVLDEHHQDLFFMYQENFFNKYFKKANKEYGWTSTACLVCGVGYDEKRKCLVFGITDKDGDIVNLKWHKSHQVVGHARNTIYPMYSFYRYDTKKPLIITEGEKDVVTAISQGSQAISFTAGAMSIPAPEYIRMIKKFNDVDIFYDKDETGIKGAVKLERILNGG